VRERANVFGEVAELYEARRPGYPPALFDAVLAAVPGARTALEAGAGTGRATVELARRGLTVDAVEPDRAMAAIARRATAGLPVTVHETPFEAFAPEPRSYDLVASAQAWHWVGPAGGAPVAATALRDGGVLALWWNTYGGEQDDAVWQAVDDAYRREAPELLDRTHLRQERGVHERTGELPPELTDVRTESFPWTAEYGGREYADLIRTHSDHRMLEPDQLDRLARAVEQAIDAAGRPLSYPYRTELLLARRAPR
jgi:SAM-dependent methyltransferase